MTGITAGVELRSVSIPQPKVADETRAAAVLPIELTWLDVTDNIPVMATRTVTELIDDIDGKPADETVTFGLDGVQYEIDLTTESASELRAVLDPWKQSARKLGGRRGAPARPQRVSTDVDNKAVRAWAASNGVQVSARGRIPADVIQRYRDAGN